MKVSQHCLERRCFEFHPLRFEFVVRWNLGPTASPLASPFRGVFAITAFTAAMPAPAFPTVLRLQP